jgi:chemotaxis protein methyltransferase CheR
MTPAPRGDGSGPGEMTRRDFERFSLLIHQAAGIAMGDMKFELLRARLAKRMRALEIRSFKDYYSLVTARPGSQELDRMIDAVTTNKTEFFREAGHFQHLLAQLQQGPFLRKLQRGEPLRIWSAACSSGEEAYSLAMVLLGALESRLRFKILASDLSSRVLHKAMAGLYAPERMAELPPGFRDKFFEAQRENGGFQYQVKASLRDCVQFCRFNLNDADAYAFGNKFDAIFCRNVMIYFDRPTQEALVQRLSEQLAPGGLLYTGFSESLIAVRHNLKAAGPSAYRKPGAWDSPT